MKVGGYGVVSVASHIVGKDIRNMIDLYSKGHIAEAEKLNAKLMAIFKVLFITSNPAPVKEALNLLGYNPGEPRLPLVACNASEREQIKKVLQELKLI